MPDNTYTHIAAVLDRSGSMALIKQATIDGFNAFLEGQRTTPGKATLSLMQFDNEFETLQNFTPIASVSDLTEDEFVPRGSTALFDAVGLTINETKAKIDNMAEANRPGKVVILILTDGQENSSREYKEDGVISKLVKKFTDEEKWEFLFMGTTAAALEQASSMGMSSANSIMYAANSTGAAAVLRSTSANVSSYRRGLTSDSSYTLEDRAFQSSAGAAPDPHWNDLVTASDVIVGDTAGKKKDETGTKRSRGGLSK